MTATKTTSLQKMTQALAESGWEYTVEETQVMVPDIDNAYRPSWARRATHVPLRAVPGIRIEARNNAESNSKAFTVEFTETGKFLPQNTKGGYPFSSNQPLKELLKQAEVHGPIAVARRAEVRAQQIAEDDAQEEREVAEAYAAATQALGDASEAMQQVLRDLGLTFAQVEGVMGLLDAVEHGPEQSAMAQFLAAKTQVEHSGKGWLPGRTYVRGTYVNGKKVSP